MDVAVQLSELLPYYFEFKNAMRRFLRYAPYLAANFAFGNDLYNRLRNAPDFESIRIILHEFFIKKPRELNRPNMNFLR